MDVHGVIQRIVNPEYTGENRCLPCTLVNLCIAVALTGAVWWGLTPAIAGAVLTMAVLVIAVRGYLVPGTPTLTSRFLPDRVLAVFDGHESKAPPDTAATDDDVGSVLVGTGVLEECHDGGDLCMSPDVRDDWVTAIDEVEPDAEPASLLPALVDVEDRSVSVDTADGDFVVSAGGDHVGRWPSWEAFVADATAAAVIAEALGDWDGLTCSDRSDLLAGLRVFLDVCPTCGDSVGLERRTDETCCRTRTVTALECRGCGARFVDVVGT